MKIALITGAASGLGAAIAQRLHADGMWVILTDIDQPGGQQRVAELGERAEFFALDVTREDRWRELMAWVHQQHGRLDVLVNNAGITTMGSIETLSLELLKREFAVNVDSVFLGCQNAIGLMKTTGGAIINIASGCSRKVKAELAGYNASKAAVTMLSKTVALHCARQNYGIRVNTVHPGATRTPIVDKVLQQSEQPEALLASFVADHPIGRIGEPQDIAAMVSFLASDQASFATGAEFFVDGGMTL
ncbi:short-chain dehydrogenase [Pseudomonas sp. G11-1]|nr:short-chain dehydrogenase [Pseudomonas sp. G11-1]MCO5789854.1 short-chain dehydrogenase [Pseudomonas sp. G11-2]